MSGPGRKLRRWAQLARMLADYLEHAGDLFDRLDLDLAQFIPRSATGTTVPAPTTDEQAN